MQPSPTGNTPQGNVLHLVGPGALCSAVLLMGMAYSGEAVPAPRPAATPVSVILDTDMESDVDDVGALAMLHALADRGEARILGVMVSAKNPHSAACANRINTYFGRPGLPIGVVKGDGVLRDTRYAREVAEEFPGTLATGDDAPNAVALYREILAGRGDNSVVVVTVGYKTNLRDLLLSGPCEHSELDGRALVERKVRVWICMGGRFPGGREANIMWDASAAAEAIDNWPTEIIFSGWEIGRDIHTGGRLGELPETNPVRRAYQLFNNLKPHRSWDQAALLYAVRGLDGGPASDYWDLSAPGRIVIDPADGRNTWEEDPAGTHRHHIARRDPGEIAEEIDLLMMHQPSGAIQVANADRIRPYEANPYFWQYKGEPVLLLGGSDHDNLFNHPDVGPAGLESHLDLLAACGGNYVRNTMNCGDDDPRPFARDAETGLYDLNVMGEEYWLRFENLLRWTAERDIIVQIEVFDRFNYAQSSWQLNPFNPRNNINYTAGESSLPEVVPSHPGARENNFFRSVPELENNTVVLPFQQAYVDTLLSYSLPHGNVLYCISNETNEEAEWGAYWAMYIRNAAEEAGIDAHVTEMWDPWDLSHPMHRRTFDHPEIYSYVDISQNNHRSGQVHWNNAQAVRQRLADSPRPINNVKMYGGLTHGGSYEEGLRRMWRNALGGMASARFHRPGEWTDAGPPWGAGLSEDAQAYIRTTRYIMEDVLGWPGVEPDLSFAEIMVDPKGQVRLEKTHAVYTRDAGGTARFYVNGEQVAERDVGGDLSAWDADMRLGLASEMNGERPWLGTFHDVAVHSRALTAGEVAAHAASGAPEHVDGLQARYAFDEGEGTVVRDGSGQMPALDLHIGNADAVAWLDDGLDVRGSVLIATDGAAERLVAAVRDSNAFTIEAWVTPADLEQSGPARIVTLSRDNSHRNFTLGQLDKLYHVRFRTTATSSNGLPGLETGLATEASIGAARSTARDRAAVFVTHGALLRVDTDALKPGLETEWFDARTAEWHAAVPDADGSYKPPSPHDWVLVFR